MTVQTKGHVYFSEDGSKGDLDELMAARVLAFDVEATGVHMARSQPLGFSLAYKPTGAYYTMIDNDLFKQVLADDKRLKLAHNAKYDRSMMKKVGVRVDNLCDPMIGAHLLGLESLSLQIVAGYYGWVNVTTFRELGKPIHKLSLAEVGEYSCPHSTALFPTWEAIRKRLAALRLLDVFWNVEMPLVPVLSDMELNGVQVDRDRLKELGYYFDEKLTVITQGLDHLSGVKGMNHNSPDQVADLLFTKLGLPHTKFKTRKGRPSVNAKLLEEIKSKHPYIPLYFLYKQYQKLKSTYVTGLADEIVDGRIYGSFNQTVTRTSRLSSSDPNLQNIPQRTSEGRKIRTAFVAPEGYVLLKPDYEQIELRMMAHYSQDPALLDAFRAGRDIHEETAIRVFGDKKDRPRGKTLDFQMIYGGGGISERGMFFQAYPQVLKWTQAAISNAKEAQYVRTMMGRIRTFEGFSDRYINNTKMVAHAGREAISTIVQGSSAEVVKIGMRRLWEKIRDTDIKMVLQVHDEVVLEVPKNRVREVAEVVKDTMTYNECSVPLPVTVSVGKNWGMMKELKWE